MNRQLCVSNRRTLRLGQQRFPTRANIRHSSTASAKTEDDRVRFFAPSASKVTSPEQGNRITFVPTSNPTSSNYLNTSLDSWSHKTGRTAIELVPGERSKRTLKTFFRGKRSSTAFKTLRPVPHANAEGELRVIKEGSDFKTLRRIPCSDDRNERVALQGLNEGGLYLLNEGKYEKRFIPLPNKSAADAIQEVRRKDATRLFGPREWRSQEVKIVPSRSLPGTSRAFSTSRLLRATSGSLVVESLKTLPQTLHPELGVRTSNKQERIDLRDRLRSWDVANPQTKLKTFEDGNISTHTRIEASLLGALADDLQRPLEGRSENAMNNVDDMLFKRDEILDFGDRRSFLVRGDMVELKFGRGSELAIYIQNRGGLYGFYTMSGQWLQWAEVNASFSVPDFFDRAKLEPLTRFISDADESTDTIPRDIGAPLMEKLQSFWDHANRLYRANFDKFDRAHKICAHEKKTRHASLLEIANEIVPEKFKKDGKYSASVLYALYRSLDADKIGFQPALFSREKYAQFTIASVEEANTIMFVREEVRKHLDLKRSVPAEELTFMRFITKAQNLIDQSRKLREVTQHGTLGPLKVEARANDYPAATESCFTDVDLQYIRFLESWSGRRTFDGRCRDSALGSVLLGATNRYSGMELNQSTGWVLLQELGVLSPVANPATFLFNIPLADSLPDNSGAEEPQNIVSDVLNGLRKDWGDLPIYCIDDVGAHEIDDGISIETAEKPGEYWVHIHTANPGSQIAPDSDLGRRSEAMAGTLYLPEKVIRMLPEKLVQEKFSLAPGRPSVTYSARLNMQGDILEQLVTPGTLGNVLYVTPQIAEEAIQGYPTMAPESKTIVVGDHVRTTDTPEPKPTRPIVPIEQLSEQDRQNLGLLYTLSVARAKRGVEKGSFTDDMRVTVFGNGRSKVSIQVSTPFISEETNSSSESLRLLPEPRIEMRLPPLDSTIPVGREKADSLVKNLMLLGGEIAGRWCHERSIPVIYRVSQRNDDLMDPGVYYREEIQTRILASEQIPLEVLKGYLSMVGNIQPSSTAGPHLSLGMDMFTRSTSPLRRYGDLLLQWQVQAGLLEEAKLGSSLVGSTRDDYLPFTKSRVDEILMRVKTKEFELMMAGAMAQQYWCIQLLIRAWKFKEAPLPKTFQFIIGKFRPTYILGYMPFFGGLNVRLNYPKWMRPEDVKLGDAFEVEIVDLNTYDRRIHVEALKSVGVSQDLAT